MPTKVFLRSTILKKRKGISPVLRLAKSKRILRRLVKEHAFLKAEHVAIYYSDVSEVATRSFLKKILKNKKIYLPKVQTKKKNMMFCRVRALSKNLMKGAYGIMEPKASCPKRPAERMDLIVVPGVAFDKRGGRLGRGEGYYDRLLRKAGKVPKIGLCFREQLVKKVPIEPHDVRMDKVITD